MPADRILREKAQGPGGCAPDSCRAALLLIDVINPFDFPGAADLLKAALSVAPNLVKLKNRCREAGIPIIYVNDHFGRWRSDFSAVVEQCQQKQAAGHEFVRRLLPEPEDYFVFKPMHSGFYQTTLDLLLNHLSAQNLVLAGLASNICVLSTAHDAYMRDYRLWLPTDAMAAGSLEEDRYARLHFERVLQAELASVDELVMHELKQERR